jgi:hypothetical protein
MGPALLPGRRDQATSPRKTSAKPAAASRAIKSGRPTHSAATPKASPAGHNAKRSQRIGTQARSAASASPDSSPFGMNARAGL